MGSVRPLPAYYDLRTDYARWFDVVAAHPDRLGVFLDWLIELEGPDDDQDLFIPAVRYAWRYRRFPYRCLANPPTFYWSFSGATSHARWHHVLPSGMIAIRGHGVMIRYPSAGPPRTQAGALIFRFHELANLLANAEYTS